MPDSLNHQSLTQPDARKAALATLAARHRALADLHARGGHLVKCHSEASAAAANAKLKAAGKEEKAAFKGPLGRWKKHPASLGAAQRHNGPVGVIPASLGCVGVDIDRGGDEARQEVISLLRRRLLAQVDTHRDGGCHLWYRSQHAAKIGNGKFLYGDIRGNNKGYLILWNAELVAAGLASTAPVDDLNEADLARLPPKVDGGGGVGGRNDALNKGVFLATRNGEPIEPHVTAARAAGLPEPEIGATVASATAAGKKGSVTNARSPDGLAYCLNGLGVGLRLNTRGRRYEYRIDGAWQVADDERDAWLRGVIAKTFTAKSGSNDAMPLKYSAEMFLDLRRALGNNLRIDPFRDWLGELPPWDGVPRIDGLLTGLFGAEDDPLTRWASRYIGIGAVQRAVEPGCKIDEVPVLFGAQGVGKSAFARNWFTEDQHEWHGDAVDLGAKAKEQAEQLAGKVVVELSEMTGIRKAELERLKSFITRQDDGQFRWAYARAPVPSPRRCIFIGTTNEPECLPNDPSGNRRFVVVALERGCDVEAASADRAQWWAEALARYRAGERANLPRDLHLLAAERAEVHRDSDAAEDDVLCAATVCLMNNAAGFTLRNLRNELRAGDQDWDKPLDKSMQDRLSRALKVQGFRKARKLRQGIRQMLWTRA